jgi:PAS domain S-box-containing protein
MYFYFYQLFMILSLIASLFVVVLTWRRRDLPGSGALIALAVATFVWTLGFFLESHSETLRRQLFFNSIGYFGSMTVPIVWFTFSLNYTNAKKMFLGWKTIFLCIIPLITLILVWTNSLHHLMWSNERLGTSGPFVVTIKTYGPFFWVALTYNYILIIAGGFMLLRRLFVGARLYTGQAISVLVAVSVPWLWNIIYVFNLVPLPHKDLTPVMFTISGVAIALGLTRFNMLAILPFARKFVIQQLNDGVLVFNARNCLVDANPMALRILSVEKSIIGNKLKDLLSLSPMFGYLSSAGYGYEEFPLMVSGEKRTYELEKTPMLVHQKQQVGWLAILRDITAHKQAEEQYRLIAQYSADVIYKLTLKDGKYTYVSPSVMQLFGYTDKEILSLNPKEILTPQSYEKQRIGFIKDLQNGISSSILELEAIHKDGHIVPVEIHVSLVRDEKGEPKEIVGVARDITKRKEMEEQLIMQDRLASIGQLTSGVAHEINNPLTSIISFSSLLIKRELPEDVKQDIKIINDQALRTANILKSLLTFARKQPQEKQPVNINECIQKVLELRSYEQKINNIQVKLRLDPDLPLIMGNNSQIQQVFFNLVINAEFFMLEAHKKGTLTITSRKTDGFVRVLFGDDGSGISKDNMKNLFSPFFTTKEAGKGTGLSLSICLGIISEHGGRIWAESEPGKGATFIIELPVYNRPTQEDGDES